MTKIKTFWINCLFQVKNFIALQKEKYPLWPFDLLYFFSIKIAKWKVFHSVKHSTVAFPLLHLQNHYRLYPHRKSAKNAFWKIWSWTIFHLLPFGLRTNFRKSIFPQTLKKEKQDWTFSHSHQQLQKKVKKKGEKSIVFWPGTILGNS